MSPMNVFTFALALYALSITGWYQHDTDTHGIEVATLERIILQQEKLLIETEGTLVSCDVEEKRSYTYDQWVTDKPCPPGKDGPLCHMDGSDYQ